jgi:hypothetical protein
VLGANGNHAEEQIYECYYELAKLGGETCEWCKFSLFCLIVATGNAISERGLSAMAAFMANLDRSSASPTFWPACLWRSMALPTKVSVKKLTKVALAKEQNGGVTWPGGARDLTRVVSRLWPWLAISRK